MSEQNARAPARRGGKFYLGWGLLIYSFVAYAGVAGVALTNLSNSQKVTVATAIAVSAEVCFAASAALLGRQFLGALRERWRRWRRQAAAPRPISRARHRTGLVLFVASIPLYYLAAAGPFLGLSHRQEMVWVIAVLLLSEALFYASVLVLGPGFWERLKQAFAWPGEPQPAPAAGPGS